MRAEEIRDHLRREPFRPFRVYLSNGMSYDARHQELMAVSRREVVIAREVGEDDLPERFAYFDPVHVVRLDVARLIAGEGFEAVPGQAGGR